MIDLELLFEKNFNPDDEYLGSNKHVNSIHPLVSVCIATYQHAGYIKDCIEGILMQETNFAFEIIIGDDQSTDGTREICKKYAEEYPHKIRLFLRDRQKSCVFNENNERIFGFNAKWNRKSARGKYIATCEGDDYWTDPLKLQKQVDFMEQHPGYTVCAGGYKSVHVDTGEEKNVIKKIKEKDHDLGYTFTLQDFSSNWITKTLTLLYRTDSLDESEMLRFSYSRDVHLNYQLLRNGKGFYFTEIFGVYRIHQQGIFSLTHNSKKIDMAYKCYKEIHEYYGDEISRKKSFRMSCNKLCYDLYNRYEGNTLESKWKTVVHTVSLISSVNEVKTFFQALVPKQVKRSLKSNI